jgi:hypothetical protein
VATIKAILQQDAAKYSLIVDLEDDEVLHLLIPIDGVVYSYLLLVCMGGNI